MSFVKGASHLNESIQQQRVIIENVEAGHEADIEEAKTRAGSVRTEKMDSKIKKLKKGYQEEIMKLKKGHSNKIMKLK